NLRLRSSSNQKIPERCLQAHRDAMFRCAFLFFTSWECANESASCAVQVHALFSAAYGKAESSHPYLGPRIEHARLTRGDPRRSSRCRSRSCDQQHRVSGGTDESERTRC